MDDTQSLAGVLTRHYGAGGLTLHPLLLTEDRNLYRIERVGEPPWLLHAAAPQASPAGFRRDVAVLTFLEQCGYPAPRVVRAADGSAIGMWERRPVLVTTFIDGEPTGFSPARLGRLGAMLGRLHALSPPSPPSSTTVAQAMLPPALMLPRREIAVALSWLADVRDSVPPRHQARYDLVEAACHALDDWEDLPAVLIHNDCHPGNSVWTAGGDVVLIDWEGAGLGPAVIDVGFLLVSCEIEAFRPNRLPPDPERVQAIVDGYCRYHRLTAAELDRLGDAIRFRSVVAAASTLRGMIKGERREEQPDWAWARYEAAEEIAARAREGFERHA